jgi:TatD DNase family protein
MTSNRSNSTSQSVRLFDSHCHLVNSPLENDVDSVLERARDAGVTVMTTIGTNLSDSIQAAEFANNAEGVYAAVGVSPHELDSAETGYLDRLEDLGQAEKVTAIGEIGLEYHYFKEIEHRRRQQQVMVEQLFLATRLEMPVVIHCRDAVGDCLEILADHTAPGLPIVFHCFTGSAGEVERILERGYRVGLTGIVTFKNAGPLREAAKLIPDDRLLIETDSPYCSPVPVRGKFPCEPAFLAHTARFLAELRGQEFAELAETTFANTERFYGLMR